MFYRVNVMCVGVVVCFLLAGCGEKAENNPPSAVQVVSGDFRLVKQVDNAQVWIVIDGKRSMVAEWGWVERNGKGKAIEIVKADELKSYPDTGIGYK